MALTFLHVPLLQSLLAVLTQGVNALQRATEKGSTFVFGYLGGGELPFDTGGPGSAFVLAFEVFPIILVISVLSALLWHWGLLAFVVRAMGALVRRAFRVSGAVGVSAAANIFIGMVEAPLLIRPYLGRLGRSELCIVMAGGMATIAGTMMVVYGAILKPLVPNAFGHLLSASVINAPAAIVLAAIMVPGVGVTDAAKISLESEYANSLDAIMQGTENATRLVINITALLLVFVALIALVDMILAAIPLPGGAELSLREIFGFAMAPAAWLIGIPWEEARAAGALLGTKVTTTEFVAYHDFVNLPPEALSARSGLLMTYALCSFASLASVSIMMGGLATLVPDRRQEIIALGPKSALAGFMAALLTAAIIGILTPTVA